MGITIKRILSSKGFCLAGLIVGSSSSAMVWSQATPVVDEVLVTAQMREESVQNIPLAIGVYDKQLIDRLGASSLTEMEGAIPSLNFGSGDRNTRGEITIRGVGDYARNIGTNARVAVYVDGVLTGRSSSFDQGLLDVARVEVLRGPQGTLSGTNALAGSINIITQKPEDTFSTELLANTGNYGLAAVNGKINAPLSDDLFVSLLLGTSEQDGYIRNITLDRELQGANRDIAKLKFRYVGVDQLIVDIGFDYLKDEDKSTNAEALGNGMFNGFTLAPAPFVVAHNADEFEQRKLKGATIEAVYETPENYKWTAITGIRSNEFRELSEEDYSPLNVAVSIFDEQSDQISQEIRLASPKSESWDYVVGAYFLNQDISTERQAITGPVFLLAPNGRVQTPASAEVESASLFLHGNYYFDARWSLTAGIRYVNETKDIDYSSIDSTKLFINTSHLTDQKTFNEWLPKLGLNFQMTPDVLFYTSVARGYKSGGWNADFITTLENFQFDPEYAVNYEAGVKSLFFDRHLTVNVSTFVTKFDDFQVFQFLPTQATSGTVLSLTNAGKVTSKGVELDVSAALTEYLQFSINTAYTSARFDEFQNGGGIGKNYDDHYLPYAPKNNYFVALDYARPVFSAAKIYAHIDYGYTDDYFSNPNNLPGNRIPGRSLTNARLGVKVDDSWDISLWVKNLADDISLRQKSVSFLGVPRGVYNSPRTYGLELKYYFN
ncbi:MAG TPA: TonB-dependent receptor [Cellvibrio sp.]